MLGVGGKGRRVRGVSDPKLDGWDDRGLLWRPEITRRGRAATSPASSNGEVDQGQHEGGTGMFSRGQRRDGWSADDAWIRGRRVRQRCLL